MTYTYRGTQTRDPDPTKRPDCGTEKGYTWHKRHNEEACQPCLDALAKESARRRGFTHTGRRRRPKPECGTPHGYTYHYTHGNKNPCLPCRLANSEAKREYRARKKAEAA